MVLLVSKEERDFLVLYRVVWMFSFLDMLKEQAMSKEEKTFWRKAAEGEY